MDLDAIHVPVGAAVDGTVVSWRSARASRAAARSSRRVRNSSRRRAAASTRSAASACRAAAPTSRDVCGIHRVVVRRPQRRAADRAPRSRPTRGRRESTRRRSKRRPTSCRVALGHIGLCPCCHPTFATARHHAHDKRGAGPGQRSQLRQRLADAGGQGPCADATSAAPVAGDDALLQFLARGEQAPSNRAWNSQAPCPLLGVQAARRKPNRSASPRPTARRLSQSPSQHKVVAVRRFPAFPDKEPAQGRPGGQ